MRTPDFEQEIGIQTYCTDYPGTGGKLRVRIDDFHVTELCLYPAKKDQGNFTIADVTSRNWETHTLVQELAHHLHMSQRRISATTVCDPLGQVFLRMLFFVVIPLVFASLANGVVQLGELAHLGPLAGRTFTLFFLTWPPPQRLPC